jgi:cation transport regulator ChaC
MLHFAYGSNLSKADMRKRAPGAKPLICAILPDHRLTFESNEPRGAPAAFFANVRPALGCFVPGAVYEVDEESLEALDAYEDTRRGVYERVLLRVAAADGRRIEAFVYRMPVGGVRPVRGGMPSRAQLGQIRRGYADWGLDAGVLDAALASVSATIR